MCVCFLKERLQCKNLDDPSGSNSKSVHHKTCLKTVPFLRTVIRRTTPTQYYKTYVQRHI